MNTDPRKSVRQQAHVHLTKAACDELNRRVQLAFDEYGTIPQSEIDKLDKPSIPANGTDNVLPIILDPSDVQEFKQQLLIQRQAEIRIVFEDGSTESKNWNCLLYTSPSPRDKRQSRMPSSA